MSKNTMPPAKATTLDDLDRDELLQLIRQGALFFLTERDLVWAQWQVACRRAGVLRDKASAMHDTIKSLIDAWRDAIREQDAAHAATDIKKLNRALRRREQTYAAYQDAQRQADRMYAKAEREERRADRLYARHQELQQ